MRYYACEALYNIAKVARGSVLPFFNDVFDGLSKVSIGEVLGEEINYTCIIHIRNDSYTCMSVSTYRSLVQISSQLLQNGT